MADGGGLNLGALGLIAAGWVLVWSAVNDPEGGPVAVFRDVVQGRTPTPGVQVATKPAGNIADWPLVPPDPTIAGTDQLNPSARYNLGPVRPNTARGANILGGMFGIKTVGGWRRFDQFPDHPSGRAADFMINDIPNGVAKGNALSSYAAANAASLNVDYIIWYRRVWSRARARDGWRPYTGTSNPHTDHVHITFTD